MKKKSIPTADDIKAAIDAAVAGKGSALARLVKSCSEKDLAKAFGRVGPTLYHGEAQLSGLAHALHYCAGMRQGRAEFQEWKREQIAKVREEAAAERAAEKAFAKTLDTKAPTLEEAAP